MELINTITRNNTDVIEYRPQIDQGHVLQKFILSDILAYIHTDCNGVYLTHDVNRSI